MLMSLLLILQVACKERQKKCLLKSHGILRHLCILFCSVSTLMTWPFCRFYYLLKVIFRGRTVDVATGKFFLVKRQLPHFIST